MAEKKGDSMERAQNMKSDSLGRARSSATLDSVGSGSASPFEEGVEETSGGRNKSKQSKKIDDLQDGIYVGERSKFYVPSNIPHEHSASSITIEEDELITPQPVSQAAACYPARLNVYDSEHIQRVGNEIRTEVASKLQQTNCEMQTKLQQTTDEMRSEITGIKDILCRMEEQVHRCERRDDNPSPLPIEPARRDGKIAWRISDVKSKMRQAKTSKKPVYIESPAFYTENGYKMRLRVFFDGDGIGKGKYLSLFFVIMKGEQDSSLHWPFIYKKINFKMVNQENRTQDIVDFFYTDPLNDSFARPHSKMNTASGCPRFILQRKLLDKGFVKDDLIFIECDVDCSVKFPINCSVP